MVELPNAGATAVSISQNGVQWEPQTVEFTGYSPLPVETPLSPPNGMAAGGYDVYLMGETIEGGSKYGMQLWYQTLDLAMLDPLGLPTVKEQVLEVDCVLKQPQPELDNIAAKWDSICDETPVYCETSAGPLGREVLEPQELAEVKPGIVCPMPNLTRVGWNPDSIKVKMSGNGMDWVELENSFESQPEPNPCGWTCTSGGEKIKAHFLLSMISVAIWFYTIYV